MSRQPSELPAVVQNEVSIPLARATLQATISIPVNPQGFVLFAHGSGSSRHSPRNRFVAKVLNQHHLGTVLADLLTASEEREDEITRQWRFDISLLTERLVGITDWLAAQDFARDKPIGCFGASTGAAAALAATALRPTLVKAVVSRGGRPDLAGDALPGVAAPTLLLVGGDDLEVLDVNREAMAQMSCNVELEIVPDATHLFEEPGKLEIIAESAARWFVSHLK
jgi:putative phosphoribosyl transferase